MCVRTRIRVKETPLLPALDKPRGASATRIETPMARIVTKDGARAIPEGAETGASAL